MGPGELEIIIDQRRKVTVLVADDQEANRLVLKEMLDRAGFSVVEAAAGIPEPNPEYALCLVRAPIEMRDWLAERNGRSSTAWRMRIGIHSGEAVAGVDGEI
ncbi:MAG: hypothetical protein NT080_00485 [Spirochaetes bacterium]|nr:hypothetical protein [Spirochaetota bacterium]